MADPKRAPDYRTAEEEEFEAQRRQRLLDEAESTETETDGGDARPDKSEDADRPPEAEGGSGHPTEND